MRRPRETPLLELPGHSEEALDERGEILAGHCPAPGVRAAPPVREHAPGGDEALLPRGRSSATALELLVIEEPLREIELGLDVGLLGLGPR